MNQLNFNKVLNNNNNTDLNNQPLIESTNNDMNLDLFNDLQTEATIISNQTPMQQEEIKQNDDISFIKKCIHPPSAIPGYNGLPTNDARSQVLTQWRNIDIMDTPTVFDTTATRVLTSAELQTFNVAVLSTNGAKVLSIGFIYNSTTGAYSQDFSNVDEQDSFNFTQWSTCAQLYRPNYKSLTTYLNATAFNNTGIVSMNQFNPNVLFSGTIITLATTDFSLFITHVTSLYNNKQISIVEPSSKNYQYHREKYNDLPIYIRQEISKVLSIGEVSALTLDPNTTIQIINLSTLGSQGPVPTNSQILNQSMRSYAGKALDGTFGVQRLNTISPSWLAAANTNELTNGLYQCYYYYIDSSSTAHTVPFYENAPVGTVLASLVPLTDTLWSKDMTWSWVSYSGLSLNSQTNISAQLLIKKYYVGYEVQPAPQSPWSGMINLAPKPSLQAMELMMDAFFDMKDGMPAKFNFLGGLLTSALGVLKPLATTALRSVLPVIGDMLPEKSRSPSTAEQKEINKDETKIIRLEDEYNKISQKLNNIINKFNSMAGSNPQRRVSRPSVGIKPIKTRYRNTRAVKLSKKRLRSSNT